MRQKCHRRTINALGYSRKIPIRSGISTGFLKKKNGVFAVRRLQFIRIAKMGGYHDIIYYLNLVNI